MAYILKHLITSSMLQMIIIMNAIMTTVDALEIPPNPSNGMYMKLLGRSEINSLKHNALKGVSESEINSDTGFSNDDYLTFVKLGRIDYLAKVDLRTSLVYVADGTCAQCKVFDSYNTSVSVNYTDFDVFENECNGNDLASSMYEKCSFTLKEENVNYTSHGFYGKDVLFLDNKNYGVTFGRVEYQNKRVFFRRINALLGMGPPGLDSGYKNSFIGMLHNEYGFDEVASICLDNANGGLVVFGGVDRQ